MTFPTCFRIAWWVVLLSILTLFLYARHGDLVIGAATPLDIFVFLIWSGLVLVPIFAEVKLFGVTLKRELDSVKAELKEDIRSLRLDVRASQEVRQTFWVGSAPPPSDAQLAQIDYVVGNKLDQELQARGISGERPADVPEAAGTEVRFLFDARFAIERELRRVWNGRFGKEPTRRTLPVPQLAQDLASDGLLVPELVAVIRNVYAIASAAIHAGDVTERQLAFVRENAPKIIRVLQSVPGDDA